MGVGAKGAAPREPWAAWARQRGRAGWGTLIPSPPLPGGPEPAPVPVSFQLYLHPCLDDTILKNTRRSVKECQDAFPELKQRLMAAPILAYPHPQPPFLLDTDTSEVVAGVFCGRPCSPSPGRQEGAAHCGDRHQTFPARPSRQTSHTEDSSLFSLRAAQFPPTERAVSQMVGTVGSV
ncbi:unnamed protein product [Lepidochelys kempii]